MTKRIFITATNTNIGKTYTTLKLLEYYASQGLRVGVVKPIETGVVDGVYPDGELLLSALKKFNQECHDFNIYDVVPLSYELPSAPYIASCGVMVDLKKVLICVEKMERYCDVLLIEGAGGLFVPIDKKRMMIDLIGLLKASTLLVTHCSLGCINDTLLSLFALEKKNIETLFIFNCRGESAYFEKVSAPYFRDRYKKVLKVESDIDTIGNLLYNP